MDNDLILGLTMLLFLTPIGWGVLILTLISIIIGIVKGIKFLSKPLDRTIIPDSDKRNILLDTLKEDDT